MRAFVVALQFLTRLPVRLRDRPSASDSGRSLLFHPMVGLLIGLLLALLAAGVSVMHLSDSLGASLLLAFWVVITGGLHLDGLADSADAWVGGHGDRERTLTIMKDPACGPMGVIALVVILLLKFGALSALLQGANGWPVALAPLLGRTALPLLFLTTPYVRPGGLGSVLAGHFPRQAATVVVVATVAGVVSGWGWVGLMATAAALLVFILLRRMMLVTIGGTTGDTAGALVELVEAAALVVASALGSTHGG